MTATASTKEKLQRGVDLAKSSHTTIISVGIESPALVPRNEVQKTLDPVALDLLRDLRSWIRFVTRQYWIGYREDFRDIQHYTISLVHGDQRDQLSTAGQGQGYDYFRRLNLKLWEIVAAKLAGNEKPRSGQLFFCDGLLHLMELNLRGAVIALAMACELEVFALIQDILDLKREAGSQNADDIEWRRFTEKLDDLERLCRSKFCEVGSEANRRVRELYRLRGKAAHRSRLPFEDPRKSSRTNASNPLSYVRAAEALFAWLESQQSRVLAETSVS